jgi:hypothetical protein
LLVAARANPPASERVNWILRPSALGEVHFKRTSRRSIDRKFLDLDDDPAWGPLKGREIKETRNVPLPSTDNRRIRQLIKESGISGSLFPSWDWEKFSRDVWGPAKIHMASRHEHGSTETDALLSTLERLRLHDLRHAARSM